VLSTAEVEGRTFLVRDERKDWRRGDISWRIEECDAIVTVQSCVGESEAGGVGGVEACRWIF